MCALEIEMAIEMLEMHKSLDIEKNSEELINME